MIDTNQPYESWYRSASVRDGLDQIRDEITRQDEKWGEQNHPATMPHFGNTDRQYYRTKASGERRENDRKAETDGLLSWDGILLEEVYEAFSEDPETDRDAYEAELIQVAAVALNAWTASRRARIESYTVSVQDAINDMYSKLTIPPGLAGPSINWVAGVDPARTDVTSDPFAFTTVDVDKDAHRYYLNGFAFDDETGMVSHEADCDLCREDACRD